MPVGDKQPLTAAAGEDRDILLGHAVELEGSASGGQPPYTFLWAQISGPGTTISDLFSELATVTPDEVGTYVYVRGRIDRWLTGNVSER